MNKEQDKNRQERRGWNTASLGLAAIAVFVGFGSAANLLEGELSRGLYGAAAGLGLWWFAGTLRPKEEEAKKK